MSASNGHAPALQWAGRPVKLVEFSIHDGREVRAAYAEDNERGMWTVLRLSARYADDDSVVFATVDDIEAQPFRLQQRLMRIAAEALTVNGFDDLNAKTDTADGDHPSL